MGLLDSIQSPADLKGLTGKELYRLAAEIRQRIITTVKTNGGHLASNLGVVELTIAIHRVFESPVDEIVWDTGHQSYTHKLLTGRSVEFSQIRKKGGLSGFPKRSESPHDIVNTGHASTSLSSALGLLEAKRRKQEPGCVIAVIGDGALSGGMALEALGNVSQLKLPLIIILNDNKMSISPNVGAISRYLSRLSASSRYQAFRTVFDNGVASIPRIGNTLLGVVNRTKRAIKAIFFKDNFFSDLGFEYVGPIDGHNLPVLISIFEQVRELNRPVVVHVLTTKGKGFEKAEEDPEAFHGVAPWSVRNVTIRQNPSFTQVFAQTMTELAASNPDVVAVTAAMCLGTGLEGMKTEFPNRVYDVGIAEQHAVTFAAGLAVGGLKPVVAIYSTFLQRAVDQVWHDVALNKLPVIFALDRSGAVGEDGETHQGIYDLALFKTMPNTTIFAPSCAAEMRMALSAGLSGSGGPTIIRYPKAQVENDDPASKAPLQPGRGVFLRKRPAAKTLVCALGPLAQVAARVSDRLAVEGFTVDVYSIRFACPLDQAFLASICTQYTSILTVEDGVACGGVGESIVSLLAQHSIQARFTVLGFDAVPAPQATREELLHDAHLDESGLYATLKATFADNVHNQNSEEVIQAHESYYVAQR
ncbi:MAG TPA: 1-deoxy-D-xylulose-5-phosphate synthase [Spirochaetales bacterium]|nr:1-deoxy-D-xylulose-5-phosphate synthase [Spirochaetales bacterium]